MHNILLSSNTDPFLGIIAFAFLVVNLFIIVKFFQIAHDVRNMMHRVISMDYRLKEILKEIQEKEKTESTNNSISSEKKGLVESKG